MRARRSSAPIHERTALRSRPSTTRLPERLVGGQLASTDDLQSARSRGTRAGWHSLRADMYALHFDCSVVRIRRRPPRACLVTTPALGCLSIGCFKPHTSTSSRAPARPQNQLVRHRHTDSVRSGRAQEIESLVAQLAAVLSERASEGRSISYRELGTLLDPRKHPQSSRLGAALTELMRLDARQGRPFRSALVVRSGGQMPGAGFFVTAEELGKAIRDRRDFVAAEQERVFAEWGSMHSRQDHARSPRG